MNQHNSIIADQIEQGRRLARADGPKYPNPMSNAPRLRAAKPKAKTSQKPTGHEAYLKALQESGAIIVVMTLAGETFRGRLKHADKYTISLETQKDGQPETNVFFKHAIESFRPETPPPFITDLTNESNAGLTD